MLCYVLENRISASNVSSKMRAVNIDVLCEIYVHEGTARDGQINAGCRSVFAQVRHANVVARRQHGRYRPYRRWETQRKTSFAEINLNIVRVGLAITDADFLVIAIIVARSAVDWRTSSARSDVTRPVEPRVALIVTLVVPHPVHAVLLGTVAVLGCQRATGAVLVEEHGRATAAVLDAGFDIWAQDWLERMVGVATCGDYEAACGLAVACCHFHADADLTVVVEMAVKVALTLEGEQDSNADDEGSYLNVSSAKVWLYD
jgi:hypothetical protein